MKKYFLIACLIFLGLSFQSQAQIMRSSSVSKSKTKKNTTNAVWYFKGGLGGVGFNESYEDKDEKYELSNRLGYKIDLGLKKSFYSQNIFSVYWGMDFSLGSRGFKNGNYHYIKGFTHSIQWSPLIGADIKLSDDISLDLHIGPYLLLDYYGSYEARNYYNDNYKESGLFESFSDDLGDIGGNFGIGVWYNNIYIGLDFQKGVWENPIYGLYLTNNWMFKIGFTL